MEHIQQQPIAVWNTARDAWEIPQTEGLFCEHLDVFSETFPTSGMTRNGMAYALPTSERHTDGSGCSLLPLLATPNTLSYKDSGHCRDFGGDLLHDLTCQNCQRAKA